MLNQSPLMQNIHLKALSLLISIVLWIAVLGSRNVEVSKEIPVEVITPGDLIVSGDVPDKVVFRFSGPKAFLRNILNRKEEPIRVNLSNAVPGITTYRFFQDNIQVPIGVKVQSITPSAVVIKLEQVKRKDVLVKLVTTGTAESGYVISRMELQNHTVKIKGAEGKLDLIAELSTVPINLKQIKESGDKSIPIDLGNHPGVIVDGDLPKIHVEVTKNESNFKIKNVEIKVLSDKKFKSEPREISITVRSTPDEIKQLSRSKVFGVIDMRGRDSGTSDEPVNMQLPEGVKLLKTVPEKVRVTLY